MSLHQTAIAKIMERLSYSKKEYVLMKMNMEKLPEFLEDYSLKVQMASIDSSVLLLPLWIDSPSPEMISLYKEISPPDEAYYPFDEKNQKKHESINRFNDLNYAILIDAFFAAIDDFMAQHYEDKSPRLQINDFLNYLKDFIDEEKIKEKYHLAHTRWTVDCINNGITFEKLNYDKSDLIEDELNFVGLLRNELEGTDSHLSVLQVLFILYKMNKTAHCLDAVHYLYFHQVKNLNPMMMSQLVQYLIPRIDVQLKTDGMPEFPNKTNDNGNDNYPDYEATNIDVENKNINNSEPLKNHNIDSVIQSMLDEDIEYFIDRNETFEDEDFSLNTIVKQIFENWKTVFLQSFIENRLNRDEDTIYNLLDDMEQCFSDCYDIKENLIHPTFCPIYKYIEELSILFKDATAIQRAYYSLIAMQQKREKQRSSEPSHTHMKSHELISPYGPNPFDNLQLLDEMNLADGKHLGCLCHIFQLPYTEFKKDVECAIQIYNLIDFSEENRNDEDLNVKKMEADIDHQIKKLSKRGKIILRVLKEEPELFRLLSVIPIGHTKLFRDETSNEPVKIVKRQSLVQWEDIHKSLCKLTFKFKESKNRNIAACFNIKCTKNHRKDCYNRLIEKIKTISDDREI